MQNLMLAVPLCYSAAKSWVQELDRSASKVLVMGCEYMLAWGYKGWGFIHG